MTQTEIILVVLGVLLMAFVGGLAGLRGFLVVAVIALRHLFKKKGEEGGDEEAP